MTLLYGIIVYNGKLLSMGHLADHSHNYSELLKVVHYILLNKIISDRQSFVHETYYYHCICRNDIYYVVIADSNKLTQAYKYLEDISSQFMILCGNQYQTAVDNSLDDYFTRNIIDGLTIWNSSDDDFLNTIKTQIAQNLGLIGHRLEKLEDLERRTRDLESETSNLLISSEKLDNTLSWDRKKWCLYTLLVCVIILVIVSMVIIIILKN